jgi:hypothetical protein
MRMLKPPPAWHERETMIYGNTDSTNGVNLNQRTFKANGQEFPNHIALTQYLSGYLDGTHFPYLLDQVVRPLREGEEEFTVVGWTKFNRKKNRKMKEYFAERSVDVTVMRTEAPG